MSVVQYRYGKEERSMNIANKRSQIVMWSSTNLLKNHGNVKLTINSTIHLFLSLSSDKKRHTTHQITSPQTHAHLIDFCQKERTKKTLLPILTSSYRVFKFGFFRPTHQIKTQRVELNQSLTLMGPADYYKIHILIGSSCIIFATLLFMALFLIGCVPIEKCDLIKK